jgi:hypothetical protein
MEEDIKERIDPGRPRPELPAVLRAIGEGRSLLLAGSMGTGKTRILDDLARAVARSGAPRNTRLVRLGLASPGTAARVRTLGLGKVLDEGLALSPGDGPALFLLDDTDAFRDQLGDAQARGTTVATAGRGALPVAAEHFSTMDLFHFGLREWVRQMEGRQGPAGPSLMDFLDHGGSFVSARANPGAQVERLLLCLLQDVLLATEVRDPSILFDMSVDILKNPGRPVSATRMRSLHTRSLDQARMFLAHLQRAGLIRLIGRLEDRGRRAAQASRLCFPPDTALPLALRAQETQAESRSEPDESWLEGLLNTAVLDELERRHLDVFCWRYRERWGLAVAERSPVGAGGEGVSLMLDVQAGPAPASGGGLSPLERAMSRHGCRRGLVLRAGRLEQALSSSHPPSGRQGDWSGIQELALSEWLRDPVGLDESSTDIKVNKKTTSRRSHLL